MTTDLPEIRALGPGDAAAAQRLVGRFHESIVSERHLESLLGDDANLLLMAEADERAVGFVWAHWLGRLRLERRHLFVYEVEVAAAWRRRGVGTGLMREALDRARRAEAEAFVFTNHSNPAARAFYESLGGIVKNGDDLLLVFPASELSADGSARF